MLIGIIVIAVFILLVGLRILFSGHSKKVSLDILLMRQEMAAQHEDRVSRIESGLDQISDKIEHLTETLKDLKFDVPIPSLQGIEGELSALNSSSDRVSDLLRSISCDLERVSRIAENRFGSFDDELISSEHT
jgi:hypothetical protein